MRNRQIGHVIATAAILVQAPRLVLALLAADRQPVATSWQRGLLVMAGIGTAVVLTGGNLYLAHTLATATRWRGKLACIWLVVLFASGSLVVPLIAGGLGGRPLYQVLGSERLQWAWAVLAALAHEVTAAGCMLAIAERRTNTGPELSAAGASQLPAAASAGGASAASAEPAAARAGAAPASAEPASGSAAQPLPCRSGCGRWFSSAQAERGHLRHCPARQEQLHRRRSATAAADDHASAGSVGLARRRSGSE